MTQFSWNDIVSATRKTRQASDKDLARFMNQSVTVSHIINRPYENPVTKETYDLCYATVSSDKLTLENVEFGKRDSDRFLAFSKKNGVDLKTLEVSGVLIVGVGKQKTTPVIFTPKPAKKQK